MVSLGIGGSLGKGGLYRAVRVSGYRGVYIGPSGSLGIGGGG